MFTLETSIWTYWKTVGKDPYREASGIHKRNGYDQDAYRKLTVSSRKNDQTLRDQKLGLRMKTRHKIDYVQH